jgi:multicomponent Na+:H+ antiporter subunit E
VSIFLPILLLAVWLFAWGEVSIANIVGGLALVALLLVAFPPTRARASRARVNPLAIVPLVVYVLGQLVVSNVLVAREILSRRSRVRTGVIAYRVRQPSDAALGLIANIIALTPGMMTVDVTRDPPVVYVHFLLLSDVDEARRVIGHLERLVVAVVGEQPANARHTNADSDER